MPLIGYVISGGKTSLDPKGTAKTAMDKKLRTGYTKVAIVMNFMMMMGYQSRKLECYKSMWIKTCRNEGVYIVLQPDGPDSDESYYMT